MKRKKSFLNNSRFEVSAILAVNELFVCFGFGLGLGFCFAWV
jgi:hypothetical protein